MFTSLTIFQLLAPISQYIKISVEEIYSLHKNNNNSNSDDNITMMRVIVIMMTMVVMMVMMTAMIMMTIMMVVVMMIMTQNSVYLNHLSLMLLSGTF